MKKLLIISALLFSGMLRGQEPSTKIVRTENIKVELQSDNALQIDMNLVLPEDLKVGSNRMMIFTPVVRNSDREVTLPPIYVYGRKRQIINKRKHILPLEGSQIVRRTNHEEQAVGYSATIPYASWMKGADIILEEDLCGCGNQVEENNKQHLAQVILPEPFVKNEPPVVAAPKPIKKEPQFLIIEGKAFIDFPVNKTIINPQYRKNPVELARIDSTFQSIGIRNIRRIYLHGYASPESPYSHNASLAQERTQALKKYILDKYQLDDSIFSTDHTPEDWEGLIRLAEACDWKEKARILEIARSNADPDEKEKQLKSLTDAYLRMSKQWFPALRHTDYRIEYVVKQDAETHNNVNQ